eukprot:3426465-Lingulodinium_polyedra.AAC.1
MEMGCGRLGWHLLDPRTGVVWVVRPYRAYHPELQTHVGPRPAGSDSSGDEPSPGSQLAIAAGAAASAADAQQPQGAAAAAERASPPRPGTAADGVELAD